MKLGWALVRFGLSVALVGALVVNPCAEPRQSSGDGVDDQAREQAATPRQELASVPERALSDDRAQALLWSEQLRGKSVSGQYTGFANVPGEFFLLQNTILTAAASGAMDRLLDSDVPQARAMALAIYARDPANGSAKLSEHLCDDGKFPYNPNGCVEGPSSVGEFARVLLEDPGVLGGCETCKTALFGPRELWRLDWLALSTESCPTLYELATQKIRGPRLDALLANPSWKALAHELQAVEPWRRVKALARVMARADRTVIEQKRFRELLVATAASRSMAPSARLAAASALTRAGGEETLATLERLQPELDALEPGEPGQVILRALRGRLTFDAETEGLRRSTTWMETQALAPNVISTFERFGSEPFALDLILEKGFHSFGSQTDAVRVAVHRALQAQVERAVTPFATWDIESDLAYRLRRHWLAARDDAGLGALLAQAGPPTQDRKRALGLTRAP